MESEQESLNWTQSLRDLGTYYNNLNELGDVLIYIYISINLIVTSILRR